MNSLALLLTIATSVLVLHSGDRYPVDGAVREENGVVTFRSGGVLYSLPASEVATIADAGTLQDEQREVRRFRVTDEERKRLVAQIAKNRGGASLPEQPPPPHVPPAMTPAEEEEQSREEWQWRREARAYEEALRRAVEELALLERKAEELRFRINGLIALGYQPHQFTYDTTILARTLEAIPYARLDVERAQRAYDEFREDARRMGVLPGWLR